MPAQNIPSADWWTFIEAGAGHVLCNLRRPVRIASLCSGLLSEAYVCTKLKIPFRLELSCDTKLAVLSLLKRSPFGFAPDHHYGDIFDLLEKVAAREKPEDLLHPELASPPEVPLEQDVLVSGFPCQPYSICNAKRFKPDGVESHPKRAVTFAVVDAIACFKPRSFLLENVMGFSKRSPGSDDTPLEQLLQVLRASSLYHIKVVSMHLQDWVEAERDRFSVWN